VIFAKTNFPLYLHSLNKISNAQVAKLVDALCSGRSARKGVLVRIQSWALEKRSTKVGLFSFIDVATAAFQRFSSSFRASSSSLLTAPPGARIPQKRWDKKVGLFLLTAVFSPFDLFVVRFPSFLFRFPIVVLLPFSARFTVRWICLQNLQLYGKKQSENAKNQHFSKREIPVTFTVLLPG
jgi:hypothetical protein